MKDGGDTKRGIYTKAGEETSQAVYPRASNVFLIPPLGKEDASGSCWMSSLPEKTFNYFCSFAEFDKAVMLFGCSIRQGLKPVRVVGDVEGFCPTFHTVWQLGPPLRG